MSWYYSNKEEAEQRGIDYDLDACLDYNLQDFGVTDIEQVLAVHEGEADGEDWYWILALKSGSVYLLVGVCDYTGWDCWSDADSYAAESPQAAADMALDEDVGSGVSPRRRRGVRAELLEQLATGKAQTWREAKDKEFGL